LGVPALPAERGGHVVVSQPAARGTEFRLAGRLSSQSTVRDERVSQRARPGFGVLPLRRTTTSLRKCTNTPTSGAVHPQLRTSHTVRALHDRLMRNEAGRSADTTRAIGVLGDPIVGPADFDATDSSIDSRRRRRQITSCARFSVQHRQEISRRTGRDQVELGMERARKPATNTSQDLARAMSTIRTCVCFQPTATTISHPFFATVYTLNI